MIAVAPARAMLPLDHLDRMSDARGLFEHAANDTPRREHGYCLDDVARALALLVMDPEPTPRVAAMTETYLRFVEAAFDPDGRARNRMDAGGSWTDTAAMGDWWGRAVAALGAAAAHAPLPMTRARAMRTAQVAIQQRPVEVRTAAYAIPGVCEIIRLRPAGERARYLLREAVGQLPQRPTAGWDWIEARLRYGNAAVPEALLAAGESLGDEAMIDRGLAALEALLRIETRDGHLSVTGPAGRGPGEDGPLFDQQPIEIAAIAAASDRAFSLTEDPRWRDEVARARAWFLGDNDTGIAMVDVATGAGFDGLEPDGRNDNRGAESTLAALDVFRRAERLGLAEDL